MSDSRTGHRAAIGFWRDQRLDTTADAFARIIEHDERAFLICGNAARTGFERATPALSHAMLDEAVRSLRTGAQQMDIDVRLRDAFRAAEGIVRGGSASDHDEAAAGWLLIACVADHSVWVRWAGGEEAMLLKDGEILRRTVGHTAANQGQPGPDLLVRGLGQDYGAATDEAETHPWKLDGGERIVVISRSVVRRIKSQELLRTACTDDVASAAADLAAVPGGSGEVYGAAIIFQT